MSIKSRMKLVSVHSALNQSVSVNGALIHELLFESRTFISEVSQAQPIADCRVTLLTSEHTPSLTVGTEYNIDITPAE